MHTRRLRLTRVILGCAALLALLATALLVITVVPARDVRAQGIIYVDPDAPGANDGSSWTDAYTDLQTGLGAAASGDELWVAEGTYKPTTGDDRNATFSLKSGVAIYGGFGGYGIGETLRTQRDWVAHPTVLSGDIDVPGYASDNVYHVVSVIDVIQSAVLDGFTITAGNASGTNHTDGGGMISRHSDPTLANLVFVGNAAGYRGGGMYTVGGDPTLTNVTFTANTALEGGGMYNEGGTLTLTGVTFNGNTANSWGGGMLNDYGAPMLIDVTFTGNTGTNGGGLYDISGASTLTDVTFSGNTASSGDGGGIYNNYGDLTLTNVSFRGNTAAQDGGGIYDGGGDLTLVDVTFVGNAASYSGGGICNFSGGLTLTDAIFSGNTAQDGGGMYNCYGDPTLTNVTFSGNTAQDGGGMENLYGDPVLTNCILWDNSPDAISGPGVVVRYSLVQYGYGGYADVHNLTADPHFVDADGPDDVFGTPDDDLRLRPWSPAIDAGDNTAVPAGVTTDLAGNPRLVDVLSVPDTGKGPAPIVDMGAYEADPGLWLVKQGAPAFPAPGDRMTYTLAFANDAASVAAGVVITDLVPGPLSGVTVQSTGAPLTEVGSTDFVWQAAALAPGVGGTITVTGIVSPELRGPFTLTNTAVITAAGVDADSSDNQGSVITFVPGVLYVDRDGPGAGTGLSWTAAFTTVQAALEAAALTAGDDEIWVAEGTYTPTNAIDRTATFSLPGGVRLYGGFAGYGISETLRLERDWEVYSTTLSGDVGVTGDEHDNAYHVVTIGDVTGTVVLDGLIVTGGHANGWENDTSSGGGVHTAGQEVILANVTLRGNSAYSRGGGLCNTGRIVLAGVTLEGNRTSVRQVGISEGGGMWNGGQAVLERVSFTGNVAEAGLASGMSNYGNATLEQVIFSDNTSAQTEGGMRNRGTARLTGVTFRGNVAERAAGGMSNLAGSAVLVDVLFEDNLASSGGGMYNTGMASLTRVTFRNNAATNDLPMWWSQKLRGGGLYAGSDGCDLTLIDVVLEGNQAGLYGGGMCNEQREPDLVNVTFEGNVAGHSGGGMANTWYDGVEPFRPVLVNVRFSGNQAANTGGGMFNHNASPDLRQVTFSGNVAQVGGGMYTYGDGATSVIARPVVYNTIFWHNQDQDGMGPLAQVYDHTPFAMSTIAHSLVEGGCPPAGGVGLVGPASTCSDLLSGDPLFVRAPDPGDGDWATPGDNDYGDLRLLPGSPAVGAGDNGVVPGDILDLDGDHDFAEPFPFDLGGNPRIQHAAVDLGAHEAVLHVYYLPLTFRE